MKRVGLSLALVAFLAMVLLVAMAGEKRPPPIGLTMLGWNKSSSLADTNQYAMIQLTNRTAHAHVVGLAVQALNWRGYWDPVPEKLVLEPGIANVMFVLPARSSTNITIKWLPGCGTTWRLRGEYDRIAGKHEARLIHWANRIGLRYPFLTGGKIPPQEIGAPSELLQRMGASRSAQETNQTPPAAGSRR